MFTQQGFILYASESVTSLLGHLPVSEIPLVCVCVCVRACVRTCVLARALMPPTLKKSRGHIALGLSVVWLSVHLSVCSFKKKFGI